MTRLARRRLREERRPAIRGDKGEDRIGRQRGIAGEINPGVDLAQQAPRQEADTEVRRLFDAVRPDDAGLDRVELARAVRSGRQAAEAAENTAASGLGAPTSALRATAGKLWTLDSGPWTVIAPPLYQRTCDRPSPG